MTSQVTANAAKALKELFAKGGKGSTAEETLIAASKSMMVPIIHPLLRQMRLGESTTSPIELLDEACGSGVVIQELQQLMPPEVVKQSRFMGSDLSAAAVGLCKRRAETEGWVNTEFKELDSTDTKLPDQSFTHVSISLGLHIIPDPDAAIKDCLRILKPGGQFGATTWNNSLDYQFWQDDVRTAFKSFTFEAPFAELGKFPMQMHENGVWTDRDWVEGHLKELGLQDVEVNYVPGVAHMENAEHFVMVCRNMISWCMGLWWSEETKKAHPLEEVEELTKKHLEEKYGGKGWDLYWQLVCMTGRKSEA